ncbi:TPA: ABC transporter ATP-binding protein [Candidatus Bathyarchaeota archaeon]|nr:ABC transporter ATP-binding protein [Candidatus Bathyarchaeota archaeon]
MVVENLTVIFSSPRGEVEALRDVSFSVQDGEFVVIIGPSGCGKSTLLNAISGLIRSEDAYISGEVAITSPSDKGIGYLFQKDTLLPWRTVLGNIEVGLEVRGASEEVKRKVANGLIRKVGLQGFENKFPHELSGGMRQRVSIARTLAYNPDIILMDEPFGALDAQTRILLQDELLKIWRETRKTILLVTHDLSEAITLAKRILLMSARPGTIRKEYRIDLPESRSALKVRFMSRFTELYREIWKELSEEVYKQLRAR